MVRSSILQMGSRSSLLAALAVGSLYVVFMYGLAYSNGYQFDAETPLQLAFFVTWISAGQLLLAGIPVYLFVQYGYLTPVISFLLVTVHVLNVELSPGADSPLAVYGMFWIVPLVAILVIAGLEHGLRATFL